MTKDIEPFGYFKAEPFGWADCAETDDGAVALFSAPPGHAAKVAELEAQLADAQVDIEESDTVRHLLATLLSETAVSLKGEEDPLHRHSWHDLPVVALAAMLEIELLKQKVAELQAQRDELLAALEQAIAWVDGERTPIHMLSSARSIIARVKGNNHE